eukprot:TRINITY_DN6939_c0_g1_i1.p1 TRINITY_DN6939_c0_g1~~TRINITY_DN6939_c0_g1_i1.p1  ORF type:complete len:225 (+),score=92.14 TRINITY_DN6939_c0_g1_i1:134-808(+)
MRPLQELDEPLAKAWVRARLQPLMEDDDATEHLAKYVMLLVKGLTDDRAATEETAMGRLRGELDEFLQDSAEGFVRDLFGAHAAGKFRRRAHGPRSRSPQRRASARSEAPAPMEEEEVIVEGVAGSDARNGDDRAAMFEDEEANDYSGGDGGGGGGGATTDVQRTDASIKGGGGGGGGAATDVEHADASTSNVAKAAEVAPDLAVECVGEKRKLAALTADQAPS